MDIEDVFGLDALIHRMTMKPWSAWVFVPAADDAPSWYGKSVKVPGYATREECETKCMELAAEWYMRRPWLSAGTITWRIDQFKPPRTLH